MIKVKKAVIAAAGNGTRFHPITTALPKEMLPIVDRPLIHYVLEEALVPGIEEIILVLNKKKQVILDYLKYTSDRKLKKHLLNVKITPLYQETQDYGDAIPVRTAEKFLKEPFLVLWADSFSLRKFGRMKRLVRAHKKFGKPVLSLIPITPRETEIYGVPRIETFQKRIVKITELLEKPGPELAPSLFAAPGGYLLSPDIFEFIHKLKPNKKGEYSLPDALNVYCQRYPLLGRVFKKPFFEAGNPVDFAKSVLMAYRFRKDLSPKQSELFSFAREITQ